MIGQEDALRIIENLSLEEIPQIVVGALSGIPCLPSVKGFEGDPAEDIFIQVLRHTDEHSQFRVAVLRGCRQLLNNLSCVIDEDSKFDGDYLEKLTRICRLIDMAKPEELRPRVIGLLMVVLETPNIDVDVASAVIRAAMGYLLTEDDIPIWERVIREPQFAAYAFNAIMQIAPTHERVGRRLAELWAHQIMDGWPADVAYLAQRVVDKTGSKEVIRQALQIFSRHHADLWPRLKAELERRTWSRAWISLPEIGDAPIQPLHIEDATQNTDSQDYSLPDFDELVKPIYVATYLMMLKLTGNRQDAEDLTQETILTAYQRFESFQGGPNIQASFNAWLRTVALRVYIKWTRTKPKTLPIPAGVMSNHSSPEQILLDEVMSSYIEKAVQGLSLPLRQTFILIAQEGMSYQEVADILEVPIATIRLRYFHARVELRSASLLYARCK